MRQFFSLITNDILDFKKDQPIPLPIYCDTVLAPTYGYTVLAPIYGDTVLAPIYCDTVLAPIYCDTVLVPITTTYFPFLGPLHFVTRGQKAKCAVASFSKL